MEFSLAHYLPVVRLSYHQISFFPRSYSYYNRNKRFELIKLLENQELLNECGIYFCTGIYFFKLALKLLRKAISAYGRTNKVKAMEFDERLRKVVDDYNSRDKLVFTNEVVSDFVNDLSDQLLQILRDLQEDQSSFQKMGISFEEKAFYDILVKVRDDHGFPYADEKCVVLAKKIKELVDDKAQFADWSTRDDIKNQLNMELTVLLYQNGYPPEWDEEVFEKVMEQAENFKKYAD